MQNTLPTFERDDLRAFCRWLADDSEGHEQLEFGRQWLLDLVATELERRGTVGNQPTPEIALPGDLTSKQLGQLLAVTISAFFAVTQNRDLGWDSLAEFLVQLHYEVGVRAVAHLISLPDDEAE